MTVRAAEPCKGGNAAVEGCFAACKGAVAPLKALRACKVPSARVRAALPPCKSCFAACKGAVAPLKALRACKVPSARVRAALPPCKSCFAAVKIPSLRDFTRDIVALHAHRASQDSAKKIPSFEGRGLQVYCPLKELYSRHRRFTRPQGLTRRQCRPYTLRSSLPRP